MTTRRIIAIRSGDGAISKKDFHDDSIVMMVVGVRGSGKTYRVKRSIVDFAHRIVIFDPHGEYDDKTMTNSQFRELCERGALPDRFLIIVKPAGMIEDEDVTDALRMFVDTCEKYIRNAIIIVEECGMAEGIKRAQRLLSYMAAQSRHWHCPLIFIAQRAMQIPKTVRSQSNIVISFAQTDTEDIEALDRRFGPRNKGLADEIPYLEKRQFVIWRQWESAGRRGRDDDFDETSRTLKEKSEG